MHTGLHTRERSGCRPCQRHAAPASGETLNHSQSWNWPGATVREVIEMVERVAHRKVPVEWTERRRGDPPILVADATLARDLPVPATPLRSSDHYRAAPLHSRTKR